MNALPLLLALSLTFAAVALAPQASARCLVGTTPDCIVFCPTSGCVPCSPGGWCCWSCHGSLSSILA